MKKKGESDHRTGVPINLTAPRSLSRRVDSCDHPRANASNERHLFVYDTETKDSERFSLATILFAIELKNVVAAL
jgi:hypothetical protein